ncbi:hypothetical protein, partial [Malaciobacter molluscorum]|uniref:hypothetical protein n=1 Tax=Malaciobacter molluscorum TaxID=1032072 RepID=UPI0018C8948F
DRRGGDEGRGYAGDAHHHGRGLSEDRQIRQAAPLPLPAREPEIKDIYIDEDGLTIAVAETKVEDTPVTRIIMGEAYLKTDKSDKPRRFLCPRGSRR